MTHLQAGWVVLLGSGETSAHGGKVFERVTQQLAQASAPVQWAILETPAGFEPNAAQVAGRVAEFLRIRLQNYQPQLTVVPARQRGTAFSPDDPALNAPLLTAQGIYFGAGSPTYTVRQLQDSWAWQVIIARQRLGAALVVASAASIALGRYALPVYEIYKVGEDPHWKPGLDFFGPYGLALVIVPHWNNAEGGATLDTSRCFMGQARFATLQALLPPDTTLLGIDEHTALVMDLAKGEGTVIGRGSITCITQANTQTFTAEQTFPLALLGEWRCPEATLGIAPEVWAKVQAALAPATTTALPPTPPPDEVEALLATRATARAERRWADADALRQQLATLGWVVKDTKEGQHVQRSANG